MALSLSKGGNLSLTKTDPNLNKLLIGLGWDERATSGAEFDLDASIFLVNTAGKVRGDHDFIFYNQLKSDNGAGAGIQHIYGNSLTLWQACADIIAHWKMLFKISDYNHRINKISYWEYRKGAKFLKDAKQNLAMLKQLDAEFPV